MFPSPRFDANNIWKVYHKFIFWKWRSWYIWYKNGKCQFVALISIKSFRMFTYFLYNLVFNKELRVFMKLATFFVSSTKCVFTKLLAVTERSIKIKVTSITYHNFAYFSLQTKTFAQGFDCAISLKLRIL